MIYKVAKRIIDLSGALLGLIVLCPVWTLIMIAIPMESKGPIFFTQIRVGRNLKHFTIFKFRTMHVNSAPNIRSDGTYITKKNDLRITRIGKLIRFGFDELPQLVNILLGDMSVVGPRPDLPHQVDKFPEEYKKKYTVKPGLTSLPAISGRNNLDFEERLKLDLYYINHQTVIMDIRIILATILMPLKFAFK